MTLINATLSPAALAYVVGCSTSKEVWDALEKHYSSTSRTNVVNLKSDLQSILKKSGESIDDYVKRIKEIKDKLANVSSVVNDEDLFIYTLNGLPSEYNTFKTSLRTRSQPPSFAELHVLLKSEESAIEKKTRAEESVVPPTALFANSQSGASRGLSSGNPFRGRSQGRGRNQGRGRAPFSPQGRGRGSSFPPNPFSVQSATGQGQVPGRVVCQICLRPGHSALDCYNRMNYSFQGRHPPAQLAALTASHNTSYSSPINNVSSTWLTDSGCNTHVTPDLNNLSTASEYNGDEQVSVGSG